MTMLERAERIRVAAFNYKKYEEVSKETGVGVSWLAKFADGRIKNPTISKISQIEVFFESKIQSPTVEAITHCEISGTFSE